LTAVTANTIVKRTMFIVDEAPGIVGVKEDCGSDYVRKGCIIAHETWALFAGGQKQTHMDLRPHGCDG